MVRLPRTSTRKDQHCDLLTIGRSEILLRSAGRSGASPGLYTLGDIFHIRESGPRRPGTGVEDGDTTELRISALEETRVVAGVETRVVEEREVTEGKLREVSRNYFAISRATGDVYYFGEKVDFHRHGKLAGHEGSWLAGEGENRYGLAMPAEAGVGMKYYQEIAPGIAMDRAEIVSLTDTLTVHAGRIDEVLKIEETTPLEPGVKEYKYYATGIGLIKDGSLTLEEYGFPKDR